MKGISQRLRLPESAMRRAMSRSASRSAQESDGPSKNAPGEPEASPRSLVEKAMMTSSFGFRSSCDGDVETTDSATPPPPRLSTKAAAFYAKNPNLSLDKITKTREEWKKQLPAAMYLALCKGSLGPPFQGKMFEQPPAAGFYNCGACDNYIFDARLKEQSERGYAAFPTAIVGSTESRCYERGGQTLIGQYCSRCDGFLGNKCNQVIEVCSHGLILTLLSKSEMEAICKLLKQRSKFILSSPESKH